MQLDLSVVIPCYNCEKTIIRCLDSIPKQAGVEIILVDDCSADRTAEVIKSYKSGHPDENIRLIQAETNLGAGEARNKGIGAVTKKYLTFVDSDDELAVAFGKLMDSELDADDDCLIFDAEMISRSGSSVLKMFYSDEIQAGGLLQKDALVYVRPATWGKIYRAEMIREHEVRFGRIQRNEDLVFTKTALCYCKSVRYLDIPLYRYYDNPNSLMNDRSLLTEKNAVNAVSAVKETIIRNGFTAEFNSIYFLEIVYATTLTLLRMGKSVGECRAHFKKVHAEYQKKDPYRKRYMLKYRLSYLMYKYNLYFLFKLVFR